MTVPDAGGRRARANRRLYRWLAALYRALAPGAPRGPIDPSSLRRILVVRHDRIGDLVVTLPLIDALHERLPHAEIDVLASRANHSLLDGDPRLSRVLVAGGGRRERFRLLRELRSRRYDAVLSPIFGRGLREGLVAVAASHRGTRRVTVMRPKRYLGLFTHAVRTPHGARHMVERVLAMASVVAPRPGERTPPPRAPRLVIPAAATERAGAIVRELALDRFVAVNLWAAEPWREWPVEVAADALRRILDAHADLRAALVPPPGAEAAAQDAARAVGERVVVVPPAAHLLDVAALLAHAAVVITPDTAAAHLAAAVGRPVVGLYTARTVDPSLWTPYGVPHRALLSDGGAPVASIPATAVAEALESLWREVHGAG